MVSVLEPAYIVSDRLTLDQVKTLTKNEKYVDLVCAIFQNGSYWDAHEIDASQLQDLIIKNEVPTKVLNAMLGFEAGCAKSLQRGASPSLQNQSGGQAGEYDRKCLANHTC